MGRAQPVGIRTALKRAKAKTADNRTHSTVRVQCSTIQCSQTARYKTLFASALVQYNSSRQTVSHEFPQDRSHEFQRIRSNTTPSVQYSEVQYNAFTTVQFNTEHSHILGPFCKAQQRTAKPNTMPSSTQKNGMAISERGRGAQLEFQTKFSETCLSEICGCRPVHSIVVAISAQMPSGIASPCLRCHGV